MSFKSNISTLEYSVSLCLMTVASPGLANPTGGDVTAGSATISGEGTHSVVIHQTSDRAVINWQDFSVDENESTHFNQPNHQSVILNRVSGKNISEIMGNLSANGHVFIINKNGIVFGPNSKVDVGGLVASTADIKDSDFMAGHYQFSNAPDGSSVINEGSITAHDAGLAALVAPNVKNRGIIEAELGRVAMGAGSAFTLDLYGDNLITFDATSVMPGVKFTNLNPGTLKADGGTVLLSVAAADQLLQNILNTSGNVSAQSVSQKNGKIILQGAGNTTITLSGTIDASNGTLTVASANTTIDTDAATVYNAALNNNTHVIVKSDNDVTINSKQTISWNNNATLDVIADADHNASGTITMKAGNIATTAGTINFYYNPTTFGKAAKFAGVSASKLGVFNPYMLINTPEQLQAMNKNIRGAYALNTDLTMTSPFTSIANFAGKFNGNNFAIIDLNIAQTKNDAGLFGIVKGGMIRDVHLINPTIGNSGSNTAAIIGRMTDGTLKGTFTVDGGSITGANNTASIVGFLGAKALLDTNFTATNSANVSGKTSVGGIFGGAVRNANPTHIGSLNNSGEITASSRGGGLIGSLAGSGLEKSFFYGDMNNTGDIMGGATLGGLIGYMQNITVIGTLKSQADVTGTGNLGGLIANITNATIGSGSTVIGPDATHTVSGDANFNSAVNGEGNTGGLFGSILSNKGQMIVMDIDLINNADVIQDRRNVGGIAGVLDGNIILAGNLHNNGDITGNAQVGGVAGVARNGATLGSTGSSLINTGNITGAYKEGSAVSSIGGVGGILGDLGSISGKSKYSAGYIAAASILNTGNLTDDQERGASTSFGGAIGRVLYGSIGNASQFMDIKNTGAIAPVHSFNTAGLIGQFNEATLRGPAALLYANTLTNAGKIETQLHNSVGGTGGIFGALHYFTIQGPMNVLVSGNVTGVQSTDATLEAGNHTGGFAGYVNQGTLSTATSPLSVTMTGNVEGVRDMGGIIGYAIQTTLNEATLVNEGNVARNQNNSIGLNVGGLMGSFIDSDAAGTRMSASGTVSGLSAVGGTVGHLVNSTITTTHFNGTVIGNTHVGGIAGISSGVIQDVIFGGEIQTADPKTLSSNIGGIVGTNSGRLSNALSGGNIISTGTNLGTLAGSNTGIIENSFYSVDTFSTVKEMIGSNQGTTNNLFSGDYTTLNHAATYTPYGWDFNHTWNTLTDHYVTLSWCGSACAIADRHPAPPPAVVPPALPPSVVTPAYHQFIETEQLSLEQIWLDDNQYDFSLGNTLSIHRVHLKGYALPFMVAIPQGSLDSADTTALSALQVLSASERLD